MNDTFRKPNAGYLINDGSIKMEEFAKKNLVIIGERHGNPDDEALVGRLIREWGAEYVLIEGLGSMELWTAADKKKALGTADKELYYQDFTKHWILIALDYPIPFIGMEYTKWRNWEHHNSLPLNESFKIREDHFIEIIEKYRKKGKTIAVVGDTHMRTIETKQLGQISPLFTKYSGRSDSVVVRSESGEIW